MSRHQDPESISHAREHAEYGEYEVVVTHEEHGDLGTLDETFSNNFDASCAANEARVSDVGITTEVREVTDD